MNDRELLELAAKAAGIEIATWSNAQAGGFQSLESAGGKFWNPLTDDGDALRLAVALDLDVLLFPAFGEVQISDQKGSIEISESTSDDKMAAVRRAIVRAAAELGRAI